MTNNKAAQAFWRRVITSYTAGNFKESTLTAGWWKGFVQCFESHS